MYSAVWGRKHEIGDGLIVLAQILVGEGAQLLQRDFPHEFCPIDLPHCCEIFRGLFKIWPKHFLQRGIFLGAETVKSSHIFEFKHQDRRDPSYASVRVAGRFQACNSD